MATVKLDLEELNSLIGNTLTEIRRLQSAKRDAERRLSRLSPEAIKDVGAVGIRARNDRDDIVAIDKELDFLSILCGKLHDMKWEVEQ